MNISFESVTLLQYRLKAAENENQAFRSGEKYVRMEQNYQNLLKEKEHEQETKTLQREIEQLKKRLLLTEKQRDAALDKVTEQRNQLYEAETALQEEKGKT